MATDVVMTTRSRTTSLAVRVAGAALVAGNGYVHLKLYLLGYRFIATIGPLFLLNVVIAGVLAVALLVAPRRWLPWAALAAGLFDAGTLGALALSVTVGLFGFTETLQAPYVGAAVAVETAGAVLLLGYAAVALLPGLRRRRDARRGPGRGHRARGG